MLQQLLHSATILRKGSRFSQATGPLQEFKSLCVGTKDQHSSLYWFGRIEEVELSRAQGQIEMAKLCTMAPVNMVSTFFESMGFKCPDRKSVAGFLQEVTSKKEEDILLHSPAMERRKEWFFHLNHIPSLLMVLYALLICQRK